MIISFGASNHWNGIKTGLKWNGMERYKAINEITEYTLSLIATLHYRGLYCITLQVANIIFLFLSTNMHAYSVVSCGQTTDFFTGHYCLQYKRP